MITWVLPYWVLQAICSGDRALYLSGIGYSYSCDVTTHLDLHRRDLTQLVSVCHWGTQFYGAAAEASYGRRLHHALQALEVQRTSLADELQDLVGRTSWSCAGLIPLVRGARCNDARILELCDHLDHETMAAYSVRIERMPVGELSTLLRRQLRGLFLGCQRRQLLSSISLPE